MELSTSGDNRKRPGMEDKISDVNSQEPQQSAARRHIFKFGQRSIKMVARF
jgi:hypothetical protein